jgi:hypothetical protein
MHISQGMRRVIQLTLIFLASATLCAAEAFSSAAGELEKLSDQFQFFRNQDINQIGSRHSFVGERIIKEDADKYWALLNQVRSLRAHSNELTKLLSHENPRVRTLAIVSLFWKSGPHALPALTKLVDDTALTFPRTDIWGSMVWLNEKESHPLLVNQTVGQIAEVAVGIYLHAAGYFYGINTPGHDGFEDYWLKRKERTWCASWFDVQLQRASRRETPTSEQYVNDIRKVRDAIDKLPEDDRAWTLLWLNGEPGSNRLVTEQELIACCQKLGPEKLLLMLERNPPSQDPDLQPRPSNNGPYKRMTGFVLRHASDLLRPSDADRLFACEAWETGNVKHHITDPTITPSWAIAAAKLQPANALSILHATFERWKARGQYGRRERSAIAIALFRAGGTSESKFLVDRFYEEAFDLKPGRLLSEYCAEFVNDIAKDDGVSGKALIEELVKDERFTCLRFDRNFMAYFRKIINRWAAKEVITDNELALADQPHAEGLQRQLMEKVRLSVDQWYPAAAN